VKVVATKCIVAKGKNDMRKLRKAITKQSGSKPKHIDPNKKIIAIDFDGTIVHNKYPFIENPDTELIEWIKTNREKYTFILWTCRHGEQLEYAVKWLKEQGIEFDLINENAPHLIIEYGDTRKIFADYYVDDKLVDYKNIK